MVTEAPSENPVPEVRKLAAIVAIDMVGFSAWVESDEIAALAALEALRSRISTLAAAHGGRVFNTAGDGFMLEFSTASGAFDAAVALAEATEAPVRIGVHLGEVRLAEGGDLLGHGVNVVARIQAQAAPNAPLFSADARRMLRDDRASRLRSRGPISLDKMNERIEVFGLTTATSGPARRPMPRRLAIAIGLAALAALVALFALTAWKVSAHPTRLALLAPDAGGDPAAAAFARSLRDDIQAQVLANDGDLISPAAFEGLSGARAEDRARNLGAGLLLSGAVRDDGTVLHVGLNLESVRANSSLWSLTVDDRGDRNSLRQRISAQVSDVIRCAGQSGVAGLRTEALKIYLSACSGLRRQDRPELVAWRQQFQKLTVQAPNFSRAHSSLALVDSYIAERGLPPAEAAALLVEGQRSAKRALALNPGDGLAFTALARMAPHQEWLVREGLLRKGLAADPGDPELHAALADLLIETGRVEESAVERERAWNLDPISPLINSGLAYAWSTMGRDGQAQALTAATVARFPSYPGSWRVSMRTLIWAGKIAEARALAVNLPAKGSRMTPAEIADWRKLSANLPLDGAELTPSAHAALIQLAFSQRSIVQVDAMLLLARLGDLDTTFAAAHRLHGATDGSTIVLFNPPAEAMWRDPRSMSLAKDLGLVAYWRASGSWPDFCRLPDLAYDCQTEAAKVARAG